MAGGFASLLVDGRSTRLVVVWLTVATGEAAVAASLVGIRQWRFAPWRRARDAAALLVAGGVLVGGYPASAVAQRTWATITLAAIVVVVLLVGRVPAQRADQSARVGVGAERP
jgi:hypothetical protein